MGEHKIVLYFHTLRNMKLTQLYYQFWYRVRSKIRKKKYNHLSPPVFAVNLKKFIEGPVCFSGNNTFQFLNLEKQFDSIDWNFSEFGKLWTYNLNYFDFLVQEKPLKRDEYLQLMHDFCAKKEILKDGYEPYPISLRGMNWIRFISLHSIGDEVISKQLYNDYLRLMDQREFHILANHLLENGFSLLFGAYYFRNEIFYKAAKQLLMKELREQILPDGAHYELSTMYHQIILHRILDCYNLVSNNNWKSGELQNELKNAAESMLGWMNTVQFRNGDVPMLNDSTFSIAATPEQLVTYGKEMGLCPQIKQLNQSGYRKLQSETFELLADVGQIAPVYQPGHSHADSLQFLLNAENKPLITDTGISTYEKNSRRQLERSTAAHNTIEVNHRDSSHVWSGFRVGKRAKVTIHEDQPRRLRASHNGYRSSGIRHERSFAFLNDTLIVQDLIHGSKTTDVLQGHLHFHPDVTLLKKSDLQVQLNEGFMVQFDDLLDLQITDYEYCKGFNQRVQAKKIIYSFHSKVCLELSKLQDN